MDKPIKTTQLKDFMSIEDLTLEMGQVTVITGLSDIGKSSFPRAYKLVATGGDMEGLRRIGTRNSCINVGLNTYQVVYDGKTYTGLTPEGEEENLTYSEAAAKLGLRQIIMDKDLADVVQVKDPLSPPFLVTEYPPIAAKYIAAMSGINPVLAAQREASRRLSNLYKERSTIAKEKADLEEKFIGLSEAPERLRRAESLLELWGDLQTKVERRGSIQEALRAFRDSFSRLEQAKVIQAKHQAAAEVTWNTNWPSMAARIDDITENLNHFEVATSAKKEALARMKETSSRVKELEEAINKSVREGNPCPFSGHPLPRECVNGLGKNQWQS